jgi:hypothetical protein
MRQRGTIPSGSDVGVLCVILNLDDKIKDNDSRIMALPSCPLDLYMRLHCDEWEARSEFHKSSFAPSSCPGHTKDGFRICLTSRGKDKCILTATNMLKESPC